SPRQGRSTRPSAQRQTGQSVCLPTSTPRVMSRPSFPPASRSQSSSLTRVARYALLIMGMTSNRSGCETSTPSLVPPIEASPLHFFYSQLRSEVGTGPGGTVGLATDPDAGRSQSDRISPEGTRGTRSGRWSTAAARRGGLADPSSELAQPRRFGHGGHHGVVPGQLSSADPRARRTDRS